jgi:hypothetical protein
MSHYDRQREIAMRKEAQSEMFRKGEHVLDTDIVDSIARSSLRWHYNNAVQDIDTYEKTGKGLHGDDYAYTLVLKHHLGKVLEYYGEKIA